jgi:hypothetical protein
MLRHVGYFCRKSNGETHIPGIKPDRFGLAKICQKAKLNENSLFFTSEFRIRIGSGFNQVSGSVSGKNYQQK